MTNRIASLLRVAVPSFLLLAMSAASCGPAKKACQEACSSNSDCESWLACFNTVSYGKACLPDRCSACFSQNLTCSYSSAYDDSKQELVCDFTQCY